MRRTSFRCCLKWPVLFEAARLIFFLSFIVQAFALAAHSYVFTAEGPAFAAGIRSLWLLSKSQQPQIFAASGTCCINVYAVVLIQVRLVQIDTLMQLTDVAAFNQGFS